MTFNPDYIPTGPNNRINDYFKKINNVRLPKNAESKTVFFDGSVTPVPVPSSGYWLIGQSADLQRLGYSAADGYGGLAIQPPIPTILDISNTDTLNADFSGAQIPNIDGFTIIIDGYGPVNLIWTPGVSCYVGAAPDLHLDLGGKIGTQVAISTQGLPAPDVGDMRFTYDGQLGATNYAQFTATGGVPPYTFTPGDGGPNETVSSPGIHQYDYGGNGGFVARAVDSDTPPTSINQYVFIDWYPSLPSVTGTWSYNSTLRQLTLELAGGPAEHGSWIDLLDIYAGAQFPDVENILIADNSTLDHIADEIAARLNGLDSDDGTRHLHAVSQQNKVLITEDGGAEFTATPQFYHVIQ